VTTDDGELAERIRMLRNYGQRVKYHHDMLAYNRRLDSLQAAILRIKLRHLDDWNTGRRRVAAAYAERLSRLPIALPYVAPDNEPIWHLYVIRAADRDELQRRLAARGVSTGLHYPVPIHHQKAYPEFAGLRFPVSGWIAVQCLSLPMYGEMTEGQIDAVVAALQGATEGMLAPSPAPAPVRS
jgi:dTDP-4-amino-4,6-dideoxygalactose transaminase